MGTLGYIAAFSETLALAVVVSKGIPPLKDALINEPEDHLKAASAWSLGQIGRHSPDHSRALAEADVFGGFWLSTYILTQVKTCRPRQSVPSRASSRSAR